MQMSAVASEVDEEDLADGGDHDTALSHLLTGLFLLGFGVSFIALLCVRLAKIQQTCRDHTKEVSFAMIVRLFLERHVPEQNTVVLRRSAYALLASTIFGALYGGLVAPLIFRGELNLHDPEYHVHLTLMTFYMFAGWTALQESKQRLPPDSARVAVAMALLGEVLIWHKHAAHKPTAVAQDLHDYVALSSVVTAICIGSSVLLGNGTSPSMKHVGAAYSVIPFVAYIGGFLGFVHQGLWFFVIAWHLKCHITRQLYVTTYFCLVTMVIAVLTQGIVGSFCTTGPVTTTSTVGSLNTDKDDSDLLLRRPVREGMGSGRSTAVDSSEAGQHP